MDTSKISSSWPYRVAYFPLEYADETLGSLIARYADRTNSPTPESAMRSLARGILRNDGRFDTWTRLFIRTLEEDAWLNAVGILQDTTMLPYVSAFWSKERRARFTASLRASQDARHDPILDAWLLFGIRDSSLNWCPECAHEEDRASEEPRWHRSHQLPWMERCPKHGCDLQRGLVLGGLSLPLSSFVDDLGDRLPLKRTACCQTTRSMDNLALWSLQILDGVRGPFNLDELRPIYRECLARTHPEFLVPQADIQTSFDDLVHRTIGRDAYARTRANGPHAGWIRFFRWIWGQRDIKLPECTELHLWFWATCWIDPATLPGSCFPQHRCSS